MAKEFGHATPRPRAAVASRREERRRRVARLLLAGSSFREMASALGVSLGAVSKDVAAIRSDFRREQNAAYQEYVEQELARLDRLQVALWPKAVGGNLGATSTVLTIIDRRCRLLGLYAPERRNVEVNAGADAVEEVRARLMELASRTIEGELATGDEETDIGREEPES